MSQDNYLCPDCIFYWHTLAHLRCRVCVDGDMYKPLSKKNCEIPLKELLKHE